MFCFGNGEALSAATSSIRQWRTRAESRPKLRIERSMAPGVALALIGDSKDRLAKHIYGGSLFSLARLANVLVRNTDEKLSDG